MTNADEQLIEIIENQISSCLKDQDFEELYIILNKIENDLKLNNFNLKTYYVSEYPCGGENVCGWIEGSKNQELFYFEFSDIFIHNDKTVSTKKVFETKVRCVFNVILWSVVHKKEKVAKHFVDCILTNQELFDALKKDFQAMCSQIMIRDVVDFGSKSFVNLLLKADASIIKKVDSKTQLKMLHLLAKDKA